MGTTTVGSGPATSRGSTVRPNSLSTASSAAVGSEKSLSGSSRKKPARSRAPVEPVRFLSGRRVEPPRVEQGEDLPVTGVRHTSGASEELPHGHRFRAPGQLLEHRLPERDTHLRERIEHIRPTCPFRAVHPHRPVVRAEVLSHAVDGIPGQRIRAGGAQPGQHVRLPQTPDRGHAEPLVPKRVEQRGSHHGPRLPGQYPPGGRRHYDTRLNSR